MNVSDSGIWIDDATGAVVTVPPSIGTQIVAPGGVIDDAAQRVIDASPKALVKPMKERAVKKAAAEKRG